MVYQCVWHSVHMIEMVTPNVGLFFLPSTLAVGLESMGQFYFGGHWEGCGKIVVAKLSVPG